jgi:2'-5' RNA ligase
MPSAVIIYPKFIPNSPEIVAVMRAKYPKFTYPKFAPHFTCVFPQDTLSADSLIQHVRETAAGQSPIAFTIRCALPVRESFSDNNYLFLVPDEGFSGVVRLHDHLYSGALAAELRPDITFIPHITIGHTPDAAYCKQAADDWNAQPFEITGVLDTFDVLRLDGETGNTIAQIPLGA